MYNKEDEIILIDWLSVEKKQKNLKLIEKIRDQIDQEWHLCEKAEKDCDEVSAIVKEKETRGQDLFSMFQITKKTREVLKKKPTQVCDITKIYVSKKIYDETVTYDYNLMKILYRDRYTPEQARKAISKLHLSYGLAMSPSINDDKVHILKGVFG